MSSFNEEDVIKRGYTDLCVNTLAFGEEKVESSTTMWKLTIEGQLQNEYIEWLLLKKLRP